MNPFSNLSEENQNQVLKYLKFFRQKRDAITRTISNEFLDIKTDRLSDEAMFSRDDIDDFCDFLEVEMRVRVHNELTLQLILSYYY